MVAQPRLAQLFQQPALCPQHLSYVVIHIGLVGQGSEGGRYRKAVHVIGAANSRQSIHHLGGPNRKADAQPGDASGFGEGAQHQQVWQGGKGITPGSSALQ